MTIDELDALPEGTKVRDHTVDGAIWVKHPDNTWHLIDQGYGRYATGFDWSGLPGDTSTDVLGGGDVELSVVS